LLLTLLAAIGCGPDVRPYTLPESAFARVEPLDLEPTTTRPATSRPAGAVVPLTLAEARALALQYNLDLRVERFGPLAARADLDAERAVFEPYLVVDGSFSRLDSPVVNQTVVAGDDDVVGGEPAVVRVLGGQSEAIRLLPAFVLPLRTGGEFRVESPFDRLETDVGRVLNPQYEQDLRFSLSQPLGRGAGPDASEAGIRVAAARLAQTQARQKLAVVDTLASVDIAYWRLDLARRVVAVRRKQLELATDQLQRARSRTAAGVSSRVDVVRAESAAASAADLLQEAEQDAGIRERALKELLGVPADAAEGLHVGGRARVLPDTPPTVAAFDLDADRLAEDAIVLRMDLLELRLRVAEQRAVLLQARNAANRPAIDLRYEFGLNGLGGSYGDAVDTLFEGNFQDHTLGLRYELNLGNRQRRERLRAATLRRLEALATVAARRQAIQREVYDAVAAIETGYLRILTARRRRDAAVALLDAEQRQYDAGATSAAELLEAQSELATAELAVARAVTEYELARVDLARATGTVLGKTGVVLDSGQ
jgi:outer membrane protein TolC